MAINLNPKCREQLETKLVASLAVVLVHHRQYLAQNTADLLVNIDTTLPTDILKELRSYITETPVFDFVYGTLAKELRENNEFDLGEVAPLLLCELDGYNDLTRVAQRLTSSLCSMPNEYWLTLAFPDRVGNSMVQELSDYELSNTIKIIKPDERFAAQHPLSTGVPGRDRELRGGSFADALAGNIPAKWDMNSVHLQVHVSGFISTSARTEPSQAAEDSLRQFMGLGLALGLFATKRIYRRGVKEASFYVHRLVDGKRVPESRLIVNSADSDGLHDLVIGQPPLTVIRLIKIIGSVFQDKRLPPRLLIASEWLFNSLTGSDEILSFVQATIAIETLLGERKMSDSMGLVELLRNRCAYLVGETAADRDDILKTFPLIYDVRSRIVHDGKKRLENNHRELLYKAQSLCRRVIANEVALLN